MSKFEIFWNQFTLGGYKNFLEGLKNTALIALFGLLIGFLLGCVIATVKLIRNPVGRPIVIDAFRPLSPDWTQHRLGGGSDAYLRHEQRRVYVGNASKRY